MAVGTRALLTICYIYLFIIIIIISKNNKKIKHLWMSSAAVVIGALSVDG